MNVLHIVGGLPNDKFPFFQPFVKAQIDSLAEAGINISILSINGYESIYNYFTSIKKLKEIINEGKINTIHAHYSYSALPTLFIKHEIPVILSLMGSDLYGGVNQKGRRTFRGFFDSQLSRFITKKVDNLIVKSEKMKELIKCKTPVDVIPNGIDFNFFKPEDKKLARQKLNLDNEDFLILFLGSSNDFIKNFNLAKKSFERFSIKFSNVKLLNPYGISSNEVVNYLNASDVLLFTSFQEGSPNVIKEAMACNLPIISTDVGDVSTVINSSYNCFIIPFDQNAIIDKLALIYNNRKRSDGREKIQSLSDKIIAKRIISLYERVTVDFKNKGNDRKADNIEQ